MEPNLPQAKDTWIDERLSALEDSPGWTPDAAAGLARLQSRTSEILARRRALRMAVGATAAVCALVLAIPQGRVLAQRCAGACSEAGARLWQRLAPSGRSDVAADFTLPDASGRLVRLSDSRGSVVLLNFWATWCPPCKEEIPWFVEFQESYAAQGFRIIGVSLDEDGWEAVRPFLASSRINYTVVVGNDDLSARFGGVSSLPTTLLIDRGGRIVATYVGMVSKADYRGDIEDLLRTK